MTREEAERMWVRLSAIWPAHQVGDDTMFYWLELLHRTPLAVAERTVELLAGECKFFPSVAEWQGAARRAHDALSMRPVRALEGPRVRNEAVQRELDRLAEFFERNRARRPLLARDLDAAGVRDWRGRLDDARHADQSGRAFDREWAAVRAEYESAVNRRPV